MNIPEDFIELGAKGENVKALQEALKSIGLDSGEIDGVFGKKTEGAVKQLQHQAGVVADGIYGPAIGSHLIARLELYQHQREVIKNLYIFLADDVWGGNDISRRFFSEGIWQPQRLERIQSEWEKVKIGDVLILKHEHASRHLKVSAIGVVKDNDSKNLKVEWIRFDCILSITEDRIFQSPFSFLPIQHRKAIFDQFERSPEYWHVINNLNSLLEKIKSPVSKEKTILEAVPRFRLSQVARKLNTEIGTILEIMSEKGFQIAANPNSKITQEQFVLLLKELELRNSKSEQTSKAYNSITSKHALSTDKNDPILIEKGYHNQGKIGHILKGQIGDSIPLYQVLLKIGSRNQHDYFTYLQEFKEDLDRMHFEISEKQTMGFISREDSSEGLKLYRYLHENLPSEFDHFYCTNPRADELKKYGYKIEDKNGFESCFIFKKGKENTTALYVYSTHPEILLFDSQEDKINQGNKITTDELVDMVKSKIKSGSKFWWLNYRDDTIPDKIELQLNHFNLSLNQAPDHHQLALCFNSRNVLVGVAEVTRSNVDGNEKLTGLTLELIYRLNENVSVNKLKEYDDLKKYNLESFSKDWSYKIDAALFSGILNKTEFSIREPISQLDQQEDNIPFHLDQIEETDRLNRESIAKSLSRLLNKNIFNDSNKTQRSFMVHLQGAWGEGKSTFLNLLTKHLDSDSNKWIVVNFNAWQNQHISPPWWTLLDSISKQIQGRLSDKFNVRFWWKERIRRIIWYKSIHNLILFLLTTFLIAVFLLHFSKLFEVSREVIAGQNKGVPEGMTDGLIGIGSLIGLVYALTKFLSNPFLSSAHSAKTFMEHAVDPMKQVKKHFESVVQDVEKSGKSLAIYIDDLDRCNSTFTVELLEGIQTLFSDRKILYVVAGDRQWISTCFENHYNDYKEIVRDPAQKLGYLFLEKAFQLSIRLPKMSGKVKKDYWKYILNIEEQSEGKQLELTEERRAEVLTSIKSEVSKEDYSSPNKINQIMEKHNLMEHEVTDLALEILDENTQEIKHILRDHHELIDANPRGIKRLANQYSMYRNTLIVEQSEFDKNKLFRWLMIQNKYPVFTDWVEQNLNGLNKKFELSDESLNPDYLASLKRDTFFQQLLYDKESKNGGRIEITDVRIFIGAVDNT